MPNSYASLTHSLTTPPDDSRRADSPIYDGTCAVPLACSSLEYAISWFV